METTIVYWGYIGIMEENGNYRGYRDYIGLTYYLLGKAHVLLEVPVLS